MTTAEFNRLSLAARAQLVLKEAQFLEELDYYNYRVNLYSLDTFFVEVKISAIIDDVNSIAVASKEDMEKFINRITLPVLF